jgi:hypothetical protein
MIGLNPQESQVIITLPPSKKVNCIRHPERLDLQVGYKKKIHLSAVTVLTNFLLFVFFDPLFCFFTVIYVYTSLTDNCPCNFPVIGLKVFFTMQPILLFHCFFMLFFLQNRAQSDGEAT